MWAGVTPVRTILVASWIAACTRTAPPDGDNAAGSDPPAVASTDAKPASGAARKEPGPPASGVDEIEQLEGRTQTELLAELGEPDHKREFPMSECCTEFQIELYNTYAPGEPGNANITIREWTWNYDGYAVTAWLHHPEQTWIVLDTSRYSDDVEF